VELDWSTFALEIINFLVLIWLLKRLLYKPVLSAIAQRKSDIQRTLSEAESLRKEAQTLREEYEHRQAEWGQEKEKARSRMLEEVNAERVRLQAALRSSLEQEREKAKVLEDRRLSELTRQVEDAAIAQGGEFAAKLLSRFASAELEVRLVEMIIEDLRELSEERRQAIRTACAKADASVIVSSAHVLGQSQRESLTEAVQLLLGRAVHCEWREDANLLAGIRLSLGPWMLGANLQDELKFFTEALRPVSPTHAS
jgi:F-type H+-transporting ATPase subunit b